MAIPRLIVMRMEILDKTESMKKLIRSTIQGIYQRKISERKSKLIERPVYKIPEEIKRLIKVEKTAPPIYFFGQKGIILFEKRLIETIKTRNLIIKA